LLVHLQYVVPKVHENEHLMLSAMRGRVSSMSLNSVELPGLLGRMSKAGMSAFKGDANPHRDEAESPARILEGAADLKSAMALNRVHIHGGLGDVLVMDNVKDPERQVLAVLRARQLASMKAANPSGQIRSPADLFALAPIVLGEGLAAVHAFADALAKKFPAINDDARAKIVERWWYKDPATSTHYFFVPSRGIHDASGGTISLGDTIDSGALIYGMETTRSRQWAHPGTFKDYGRNK
jgi:ADP-dependent phosphofructokinase/glucokinase